MNAPAKIEPPKEATLELPFNLTPYREGDFERMHAPGCMLASASMVAAIFGLSPYAGPLGYAMHLNGHRELVVDEDAGPIAMGRALENLAAQKLSEQLGVELVDLKGYAMHPEIPLFATPDRYEVGDDEAIAELKYVTPIARREHWQDGPPIWYMLQLQTQFLCTKAKRGYIGMLNAYGSVDYWEAEPHQPTIDRILNEVGQFMENLKNGILPQPADSEPDADAWRALKWQSEPTIKVNIKGDEARARSDVLEQAMLEKAAAEATIKYQKRWFQRLMGNAEIAKIDGGASIRWKTNKTKAKGQENPSRVFKHIPAES